MYESKWVRFVYAFALAWVFVAWASTCYDVISAFLVPRHRNHSPVVILSALLTAAVVLPFCLQRLGVVLRGPGIRKAMALFPMARAARFLGLGVLTLCALAGVLMCSGVVVASGMRGGGTILLGMAYLKPFTAIVSPLTGVLLFEVSRLLAFESTHTGAH